MKIPKARQLPSGTWFCQLRLDGRSVSVSGRTEDEVVAHAMAIKAGIIKLQKAPEKRTLAQAYATYLSGCEKRGLSASTLAGYRRLSTNTFQALMPRQLGSLTSSMIQREINAMAQSGKSPKYISNAVGLLRPVLAEFCPSLELNISVPAKRKPDLRMPSDEEIGKILAAAAGTEIELPILMGLWLGMRMSEIRGARHRDLRGNQLHICRAIVDDVNGKPVEKNPKTYAGDRWEQVPEYMLSLIPPSDDPDQHLVELSGQAIYKRFSRLLKKAGVEHCRFHDLRRANSAVMIRLGIDSKYAQARNGWSSDHMYKQVYGYIMDDKLSDEAARIDAYFSGKLRNANENANGN